LRVEASLGIWIGAVTFTGSVIAYGKLAGKVTSAATKLPGGHALNASAALASVICLIWYLNSGELLPLLILTLMALFIGYHLIMGDWRRGYARGGIDAEFLFGLGGCSDWV
jgi:NAD(P) transhydrogenase subunit beta